MTATFVSSTGRPLKAATPFAMVAPIVCLACSAPMPAPVESPSTTRRIGRSVAEAIGPFVVRCPIEVLAHDAAGHQRLDPEQAVAGEPEGTQPRGAHTAAERRGLGDLPSASCAAHAEPPHCGVNPRRTRYHRNVWG